MILITAALACGVSLLAMTLLERSLAGGPIHLLPGGLLTLTLIENPGIAFGLVLPPVLQSVLILLAFLGVLLLTRSVPRRQDWIAVGLILGGACGNIIDRTVDGVVTDYISVLSFPVFNVADICITCGVGLLLIGSLWGRKQDEGDAGGER